MELKLKEVQDLIRKANRIGMDGEKILSWKPIENRHILEGEWIIAESNNTYKQNIINWMNKKGNDRCPDCRGRKEQPNAIHSMAEDYYVCNNQKFHTIDLDEIEQDDCEYAFWNEKVIIAPWQKGGYWKQ